MKNKNNFHFTADTDSENFWNDRFNLNAGTALLYQWNKYEELGTIDNFRIAGRMKDGARRGFFYTDSDLHKWADAASRVISFRKSPAIEKRINEYISIMEQAQDEDGYLHTFNQIHFPGVRWKNFQIEHELYCMGHFIEAGVEHFRATGRRDLLVLAEKTADLISIRFINAKPDETPGHQEIELALIKLYRITSKHKYLDTAERFLTMRGRMIFPGINLIKEFISHSSRMKIVSSQAGMDKHTAGFDFTENLQKVEPPFIGMRAVISFLTGKYQQQHKPVLRQKNPAGHSVRWAYQSTALAMLQREKNDPELTAIHEPLWDRLVERYMYVTGGTGSLPVIEGFGRAWELDNVFAYCETCAAIGNIFWNRELLLATGKVRYAEMMEWLIYNAASVGIAMDGKSYFYRNPLSSGGELTRRPWFATACCPSNISRLWGSLPGFSVRHSGQDAWIDQYVPGITELPGADASISISSGLPWNGECTITVSNRSDSPLYLHIRIPGWAASSVILESGKDPAELSGSDDDCIFGPELFDRGSYYTTVIPAKKEVKIICRFKMNIRRVKTHRRVTSGRGMTALSRGPLIYCAESADNTDINIIRITPAESLVKYIFRNDVMNGTGALIYRGECGEKFIFIPYYAWGNRGTSSMRVMVPCG